MHAVPRGEAMSRCATGIFATCLFMLLGCVTTDSPIVTVPAAPFGFAPTPSQETKVAYNPASHEIAARVDMVGSRLLAANPQFSYKPLFRTIGAPDPEIFHVGTREVLITEGLAKKCTTDGQLAAVLASELGKMLSEQLVNNPTTCVREEPPPDVRIGNDGTGAFGYSDQVRMAELAKYQKEERKRMKAAAAPVDSKVLAVNLLTHAGYTAADLDAAAPALSAAANNRVLARQVLTGTFPVQQK